MPIIRSLTIMAVALVALTTAGLSQESPATNDPPSSSKSEVRTIMENERVRLVQIDVERRSSVNIEPTPHRERILYMLTDAALRFATDGNAPFEFVLRRDETALFPTGPTKLENDNDQPVHALMIELKPPRILARTEPQHSRSRRHVSAQKRRVVRTPREEGKPLQLSDFMRRY